MKAKVVILVIGVLVQVCGNSLWARPTTAHEAQMAVTGWLKADSQPLGTVLGRAVMRVETFTDKDGSPAYYIVYLNPSGFVIVSADDLIEPIIGFADDGTYDASVDNPLAELVTNDLNGRTIARPSKFSPPIMTSIGAVSDDQKKWRYLISLAETPGDEFALTEPPAICDSNRPSDLRVAPLVDSKWDQRGVCLRFNPLTWDIESRACYNYFTPPGDPGDPNNYPSGCVATAMAQLIRWHKHPTEPNDEDPSQPDGKKKFSITVEGYPNWPLVILKGGDGNGGAYVWDLMVPQPDCDTNDSQRKAIGSLCYDTGISVGMKYYGPERAGISQLFKIKTALTETFRYANAIYGYNNGFNIGDQLVAMINPNLDANSPVILGLTGISKEGEDIGHAVVCDGYGYNVTTLYHHLNIGWSGADDCWYNLPDFNTPEDNYNFKSVVMCIYNIFATETGEIISGRVLDTDGKPVVNATVYAQKGMDDPCEAETNNNGIYYFRGLDRSTTYKIWVSKMRYVFTPDVNEVRTGTSEDSRHWSGNVWPAVNFTGTLRFGLIIVDDDSPNDPGPGDPTISDPCEDGSTDHPFDAIQEAIHTAFPGETVIILPGTYAGDGNRDLDFQGKAITVQSRDPFDFSVVQTTIIDCQGLSKNPHRGFNFHGGESTHAGVAGLTIVNGHECLGGAIFCTDLSSPSIRNCVFRQNSAVCGGAIYVYDSDPILIGCTFSKNGAVASAGKKCVLTGGMGLAIIEQSFTIKVPDGDGEGGAIYIYCGDPKIVNCVFANNSAHNVAGAICTVAETDRWQKFCYWENPPWGPTRCYWLPIPGVKSNPNIQSCTFVANVSDNGEAVMHFTSGGTTMRNCILWNNCPNQIGEHGGYVRVSSSDVEGGYEGNTNINIDPLFADPNEGDYSLRWNSPCVNTGDPSLLLDPNETDLAGNPRVAMKRIDIGPYEFSFPISNTPYADWLSLGEPFCWCSPYQCDGDVDGKDSGGINKFRVFTGDLSLIVANWRKKGGDATLDPCADIDHKDSGGMNKYRVFTGDLTILVNNWKKKDAALPGNCPRAE